jgi:hypothetical protein
MTITSKVMLAVIEEVMDRPVNMDILLYASGWVSLPSEYR